MTELANLITSMKELENIDETIAKKKQYCKEYYQKNKKKLDEMNKKARQRVNQLKTANKINNQEYLRIPYSKITKYKLHLTTREEKPYVLIMNTL